MEKILLPVDASERSLKTFDRVRKAYSPEDAEITLLMVVDTAMHFRTDEEYERYRQQRVLDLDEISAHLDGYQVSKVILKGNPANKIVEYAETNKFDVLIITRSKRGIFGKMGSVTANIVRQAPNLEIIILPES